MIRLWHKFNICHAPDNTEMSLMRKLASQDVTFKRKYFNLKSAKKLCCLKDSMVWSWSCIERCTYIPNGAPSNLVRKTIRFFESS